jgi:ParB-like partition proteins
MSGVSPAKVAPAPVAQLLALDQLIADPNQPRKTFDQAALEDLAASLRAEGFLQPILVKPNGKGHIIVDGERRYRAAKLLGLKEVPVLVRADLKDQDVTAQQLVANLQRADLTLAEQCDAVAKLVKRLNGPEGKGGQTRAAAQLGKSEAWVSKRAGIIAAPVEVQLLVKKGSITDVEIAAGLTELHQVAPKKNFDRMVEQVRAGEDNYGASITREYVRDEVADAKDEKKRREAAAAQAEKDRKAGKKAKPVDSWKAQQAREQAQKKTRIERWQAIGPVIKKFSELLAKATGLVIDGPSYDGYSVPIPPASIDGHKFTWRFSGSGALAKQIASKTGLTLKLEHSLQNLTPDQAAKIEQVLGRKLEWRVGWGRHELTGKQLVAAAAKAGTKLQIPELPKAQAKPTPKKAAK